MKIILGDICYPKSDALVIPANAMGSMTRGRPARIIKDGLGGISKEAKEVTSKQKIEVGGCFYTGPGRLNRRGLKKIYHAVIKRLQSDFTSAYIVRNALFNSLKAVRDDKMETVTICGVGIDPGELDPITVAIITFGEVDKFIDNMEIKIIDDNVEFIKKIKELFKE